MHKVKNMKDFTVTGLRLALSKTGACVGRVTSYNFTVTVSVHSSKFDVHSNSISRTSLFNKSAA